MAVQEYEVLGGVHWEPNPGFQGKNRKEAGAMTRYAKGDVVKSERELDRVFAEKFRKVVRSGEHTPVTDSRRAAVSQLVNNGSWLDSDREFLENLPEDGFSRIVKHTAIKQGLAATESRSKTTSPLGEDVTDSFQQAYDNGFKVFRNAAGKHQVTKGGSKTLNKEPLDADRVESFVATHIKEK